MSFQIVPIFEDEAKQYKMIDEVIDMIKSMSGVKAEVGPMATCVEGSMDQVLEIVKKAHTMLLEKGCSRVLSHVSIDTKKGGVSMASKMK
ncbi:unnamed protein product [Vitrella brassicaformis CCMP3155]|uniref:Thiamine-binding protein domain-containing protein n=1 Tax=Vitrella brassicaformis (strain CCMP3155) TaxID=1169540 RepID=A0A0G4EZ34_VITBC|nr:unnamed protein product [Vitrella brassicaformis CCMP3155]|eukprot:CEM04251.1 unnamed protein product [Vitrella brassicaformis CCMP3155]